MVNSLRKAIKFPAAAKREVAARLVRPFVSGSFPERSHVEIDWDNLVILDACRYDAFEKYNPFGRTVRRVQSNASHTTDFLERNLTGDRTDTVYVTSSPHLLPFQSRFHAVIHVWRDRWDPELRTVPPGHVTESAIKAFEEHPNKKLVTHYLQPHYPFIGPTGRELEPHATVTGGIIDQKYPSIWDLLSAGVVSESNVRAAYEENLELVLEEVVSLVDHIDGKTVITSDHGNLFGERVSPLPIKLYGHPPNVPAKNLISVPLVELPAKARRVITASDESSEDTESTRDHDQVVSRLEDLGYV